MYVLNPEKWGGIVREVDPEEYGLDQPVKVGAPVNTFEPVDTVSVEPEPEQEDDTVHPDVVLRNPKATKQMLLDALDQLNPRHGLDKRYNRENIRSRLSQALGYGPDADNVPPRPLPASGSEE